MENLNLAGAESLRANYARLPVDNVPIRRYLPHGFQKREKKKRNKRTTRHPVEPVQFYKQPLRLANNIEGNEAFSTQGEEAKNSVSISVHM